ncbi:MAG: iron chelate uptake ABC transporter family permease subunit [Actinomycetota bacterium]|nr:iron chelate uptake ABC transporter family permease subunit [Actinomycetota bacterium]
MILLERPTGRVPGRVPLRLGRFSGVWRPRMIVVTLVGLGLVVLVSAVNIGRGDFPISLVEVLAVLVGGGDGAQQFIVLELRLPRTLTGILVGAALGLSGAITQTVARNPLASPDILGVTAGASAAAVVVIVLGGSYGAVGATLAGVGLPIAALIGGLAAAALVYALAYRRGIEGYRLVLVGIGIYYVAMAITSWLLVVAEVYEAARATVWLTGSLNARGWEHVIPVGLALTVLIPIALLLAFGLGVLQFGDDTARGLGVRVNRFRSALILVAVGLAAVATSSAGPIVFVALVMPQICQRLVGAARPPLLASAVYGALLTVGSDLIARTVLGAELPVGIVTAILGAPYLLYLLARRNRGVTG